MKYTPVLLFVLLINSNSAIFGQGASLNATGAPPDPSAMLDVQSTKSGFLPPRMSTAQRDSIVSPAKGLEIYNTDCDNFNYNAGTPASPNWVSANPPVDLPGSAGIITGTGQVCQGQNDISYSVPAIVNATSYTWSYSGSGASFSGTANPVSISFSGSATSGNLTVTGINICGNGSASSGYAITVNPVPATPTAGSNTPAQTQIVWNWNTVNGATGYKWGTTNDYNSATDNGTSTTYTQTGLSCNTAYTLYVWAYNAGCNSSVATLTQTTSSCCSPVIALDATNEVSYSGSTNIFTINTTNANEIILVGLNSCSSCNGQTSSFTGSLTVDAYTLTLINSLSTNQGEMVIYGCVATTSGSHTITVNWGSYSEQGLGIAYAASFNGFCSTPTVAGNVQSVKTVGGCNNSISASITPAASNTCLFGEFWVNTGSGSAGTVSWTNDNFIRSDHIGNGMDGSIANVQLSGTSQVTVTAADNGGNNSCNSNIILTDIHP